MFGGWRGYETPDRRDQTTAKCRVASSRIVYVRDAARFYANALQRDSRNVNVLNAHYIYAANDCESARRGMQGCAYVRAAAGGQSEHILMVRIMELCRSELLIYYILY